MMKIFDGLNRNALAVKLYWCRDTAVSMTSFGSFTKLDETVRGTRILRKMRKIRVRDTIRWGVPDCQRGGAGGLDAPPVEWKPQSGSLSKLSQKASDPNGSKGASGSTIPLASLSVALWNNSIGNDSVVFSESVSQGSNSVIFHATSSQPASPNRSVIRRCHPSFISSLSITFDIFT